MRQCLRGHRPLAETASPLVTYKWLGDVCAQRTQQPEYHNSGECPAPATGPVETQLPVSLQHCVLPGFPALPHPLNLAHALVAPWTC